MLRKNELESIVNHHLIDFRFDLLADKNPNTSEVAKKIVEEIKRCLSLPT